MSHSGQDDRGMAMITAVIVSALLVTITAGVLLSINAAGTQSGHEREYYRARATGANAASYLYAHLQDDTGFFDAMLTSTPTTHDWIANVSTATAPDTAIDSDWRRFDYADSGELRQVECDSRRTPCWVLRFKADTATPTTVVAEAIVRYDCRFGAYCSVLRFQQHLDGPPSWTRRDLTQVTDNDKLT